MMTYLRNRPVWFTLLVLIFVAGYQFWISASATAKMAASDLDRGAASIDLELTMTVDPEQFHMVVLQDAGTLVKLNGHHAFLRNVPMPMVDALARRYWIERLAAWDGR
jgi:hypothetical protein